MFASNPGKPNDEFQSCDTIFYQGANCSQTQVMHYVGDQVITATTGEEMRCTGRNGLKPLNIIYNLHIGPEIADVNLQPFDRYYKYFNPVLWVGCAKSWFPNYYTGVEIQSPQDPIEPEIAPEIEDVNFQPFNSYYDYLNPWNIGNAAISWYQNLPIQAPSLRFHTPIFSQMSYGQQSDIDSHRKKYLSWKENRQHDGLILYGVSRGTAATFSAFATWQYPEVKLVILEGAIDSMENVMQSIARYWLRDNAAISAVNGLRSTVGWLNRHGFFGYRDDGASPLKLVNDFPAGIPVAFITSERDTIVFPENTWNIANALHQRGLNDVYVLKLKNSRHPLYAYDDQQDHDAYETFVHALYKKYGLAHNVELAEKGVGLLETCKLSDSTCSPQMNLLA